MSTRVVGNKDIKLNKRLQFILFVSIIIAYTCSVVSILYVMEYRFMQDVRVKITGIELNKEGNTFLYPYIIKYETLDHEQVGTFKSVYKYQWDEKSKKSSIADLKLDSRNNVIDGTNSSLISMLSLIVTAGLIILNIGIRGFCYFKYSVGSLILDSKTFKKAFMTTIPIAIIVFFFIFLHSKEEKNFTSLSNKQEIKIVSVEKTVNYLLPVYHVSYVVKGETEQKKFYSKKIYIRDDEKSYHTISIADNVDETSFLFMQYIVMLSIGGYFSITLVIYVMYQIKALNILSDEYNNNIKGD